MAQFDVYLNPNPSYRQEWPWVVDVQHTLLESMPTRLSIPLGTHKPNASHLPKRLFPTLPFKGKSYTLLTPFAAPIHGARLKKAQGSLAAYRAEIQASLDAVVAGV
jgi:toxin CcdB